MDPMYISACIEQSRKNMNLETIDLTYIHNSFESWYQKVTREEFMKMLEKVFEVYEEARKRNQIRYYGMATWSCFRVHQDSREYLSLEEIVKLAEKVGGKQHGFRFIQLPYNLDYPEAFLLKNQTVDSEKVNILDAAKKLNIGIFTSAPFLHGHLLKAQIPDYAGLTDPVTKAVQLIRSSSSVIAPLIGQKNPKHIEQNLAIANIPPMNKAELTQEIQKLLKAEPLFQYVRTTLTKEERFNLEEWKAKGFSDNGALVAIKILNQPNVCILCRNSALVPKTALNLYIKLL
jgi:aryl-alcohol dehydrogenase-like predicted oxidoreductase